MSPVPPEPLSHDDLVEAVRVMMTGGGPSEAENASLMERIKRSVPDPHVSDLIFWPQHHPLAADLTEAERTPEKGVELAFKYKPIAL